MVLVLLTGALAAAAADGRPTHALEVVSAPEQVFAVAGERYMTADYRVKNISNQPLRIRSAKACCDCVKVDYPRTPLAAGAEETIRLTFDLKGRLLPQLRTVVVKTDARETESLLLTLAAFPARPPAQ